MERYDLFVGWDREPESVLHPEQTHGPRRQFVLHHIVPMALEAEPGMTRVERRGSDYYEIIRYKVNILLDNPTRLNATMGHVQVSYPYGGSHLDGVVEDIEVEDIQVKLEKVP